MSETAPGIGHNAPPEPTKAERLALIDPERLIVCDVADLPELFALQYPALFERSAELLAGIKRWKEAHKNGAVPIADDAENNALSDYMVQLRGFAGDDGEVEEARKRVKKAVFEAGKVIDAVFGGLRQEIMAAHGPAKHALVGTLSYAQTQYLIRKEAQARADRERIAEEARLESVRIAQEAVKIAQTGTDDEASEAVEKALGAEQTAQTMAQDAAAPARDLVRSRSALGTTTSLTGTWDFELQDIKALCAAIAKGEQPTTFVTVDQQAIRQAIRRKASPMRECAGLEISQTFSARRTGA